VTDLWVSAHTTTGDGRRHRTLPADAIVVRRRINVTPTRLRAALADPDTIGALQRGTLGGDGWFEMTAHPAASGLGSAMWQGRARLQGSGFRIVLFTRVDIEITAWSRTSCEVSVQPIARAPLQWGARRLRRYFALGHRFTDHLCSTLAVRVEEASPIVVQVPEAGRSAA
jgi:hypothetical protein